VGLICGARASKRRLYPNPDRAQVPVRGPRPGAEGHPRGPDLRESTPKPGNLDSDENANRFSVTGEPLAAAH
jgi:hypothetical protein